MNVSVRKADIQDADDICRLIHELAEYEKMQDECRLTHETLISLMNEPNGLRGLVAEGDGKAIGTLVYSIYKLATFSGKRILYIEDIFVEEQYRGSGVGKALFDEAIRTARELDCLKLEWKCLSWNSSAIKFYEKTGGVSDPQWLTYTLSL